MFGKSCNRLRGITISQMDKTPMGCHSVTTFKGEKLTTKQSKASIQRKFIIERLFMKQAGRNGSKMYIK